MVVTGSSVRRKGEIRYYMGITLWRKRTYSIYRVQSLVQDNLQRSMISLNQGMSGSRAVPEGHLLNILVALGVDVRDVGVSESSDRGSPFKFKLDPAITRLDLH